jgi:hypothetical protein
MDDAMDTHATSMLSLLFLITWREIIVVQRILILESECGQSYGTLFSNQLVQ